MPSLPEHENNSPPLMSLPLWIAIPGRADLIAAGAAASSAAFAAACFGPRGNAWLVLQDPDEARDAPQEVETRRRVVAAIAIELLTRLAPVGSISEVVLPPNTPTEMTELILCAAAGLGLPGTTPAANAAAANAAPGRHTQPSMCTVCTGRPCGVANGATAAALIDRWAPSLQVWDDGDTYTDCHPRVAAALLRCTRLVTLRLRGREGVRNERGPGFLATIAHAPFVATTLRQLHLEVALGDGAVVEWVATHCPQLTHLTVSSSPRPFTANYGAAQWAEALAQMTALGFLGARGPWAEFLLFDRLNQQLASTSAEAAHLHLPAGSHRAASQPQSLLRLPQIRSACGFVDGTNAAAGLGGVGRGMLGRINNSSNNNNVHATLAAFVAMFPNLTEVKLARVSDPNLVAVHLAALRLLHRVDLSESHVDDRCVAALLRALPLLTDLDISRFDDHVHSAIHTAAAAGPLTLALDSFLEGDDDAPLGAASAGLPGAEVTELVRPLSGTEEKGEENGAQREGCASISEAVATAAVAINMGSPSPSTMPALPALRRLTARRCSGLRLEGLQWVAQALPMLRHLDIRDCPNVRLPDLVTAFAPDSATTGVQDDRFNAAPSMHVRFVRLRRLKVTRYPADDGAHLPSALDFCEFSNACEEYF